MRPALARRRATISGDLKASSSLSALGAASINSTGTLKSKDDANVGRGYTDKKGEGKEYKQLFSSVMGAGKANKKVASSADAFACQMALRYKLMLSEVHVIIDAFGAARLTSKGGVDHTEFQKVLCQIFGIKSIKPDIVSNAYTAAGVTDNVSIEPFLQWYVQNMFTEVNGLNADPKTHQSDKLIDSLAKKHRVSPMVLDKVKKKFDTYDKDGSGHIDFSEFQSMFCEILQIRNIDELNPIRMKKFWQEIDTSGDEGVDFEEFAEWYLKYFSPDVENPNDWDLMGPLSQFYQSYDPKVQRHAAMESAPRRATIE
jgi:hypothetical protein